MTKEISADLNRKNIQLARAAGRGMMDLYLTGNFGASELNHQFWKHEGWQHLKDEAIRILERKLMVPFTNSGHVEIAKHYCKKFLEEIKLEKPAVQLLAALYFMGFTNRLAQLDERFEELRHMQGTFREKLPEWTERRSEPKSQPA